MPLTDRCWGFSVYIFGTTPSNKELYHILRLDYIILNHAMIFEMYIVNTSVSSDAILGWMLLDIIIIGLYSDFT